MAESEWESFMFVGVLLEKKKPCRTCMVKETSDWANRSWKERKNFGPGVRTTAGQRWPGCGSRVEKPFVGLEPTKKIMS